MACGMAYAEDDGNSSVPKAPNAAYMELLGQGVCCVNYDRMLREHISVRAGVAIVGLGMGVPVSVSFLTAGDHKIEVGAGLLYVQATNGFEKIEGWQGLRMSFTAISRATEAQPGAHPCC
jgi:hypothetical protein